jgi:hypothetical protein
MKPILDLPLGTKISVLDVNMYYTWKHENEYNKDVLFILYKTMDGVKHLKLIPDPDVEIHFTKPEYRSHWKTPRNQVTKDKTFSVICKPREVLNKIYNELKDEIDDKSKSFKELYIKGKELNHRGMMKEIHKWQHVFMSDLSTVDFYNIMLDIQYDASGPHVLNKAYMDIEADVFGLDDFETHSLNKDSINAITYIIDYDIKGKPDYKKQVFTFLLRNHKRYKDQKHFEDNLVKFEKQCHEEFDVLNLTVNEKPIKYDNPCDYHFMVFDTEKEMLIAYFKMLQATNPDTQAIWNIAYDIPKIYNRAKILGINPIDLLSSHNFPREIRFVDMSIDNRGEVKMSDRKTVMRMTSNTVNICQMINYAAKTKGLKDIGGFSLDNVVQNEIGLEKRKFKKGVSIINAAIEDYWNFVLYSINDTMLQCITEIFTNHIDSAFASSQKTSIEITSVTKPVRAHRNYYHKKKLKMGLIPGNNKNTDYIGNMNDERYMMVQEIQEYLEEMKALDIEIEDMEFEDEEEKVLYREIEEAFRDSIHKTYSLSGGIVGNPLDNLETGMEIYKGVRSRHVFPNCIDLDYLSQYPWAQYTRNIGMETEIGRLVIPTKVSDAQNPYHVSGFIPGAEFISNYITMDFISLGRDYFNLPSVEEVMAILSGGLNET